MHIDKFKTEDGVYVDEENGVEFDTAGEFILEWIGLFGFCGCGFPEDALEFLRQALAHVKMRADENVTFEAVKQDELSVFGSQGCAYFMYYVLDKAELTEHGGCVPGWLTKEGKELLEDLEELKAAKESDK